MTLGDRLKQRRMQCGKAAGLDDGYEQEVIAKIADCSQTLISRAEADGARLPLWRLQRIARFYNMTVAEAFPEWSPSRSERKEMAAAREFLKDSEVAVSLSKED